MKLTSRASREAGDERAGHLVGPVGAPSSPSVTVAARSRGTVDRLGVRGPEPGAGHQEVGLVERQPFEQHRSVLEDAAPSWWTWAEPHTLRSPTRRSAPCCGGEAHRPGGPSWRADRGAHAERAPGPAMSPAAMTSVDRVDVPARRAGRGQRHRVREVAAVQQRRAPGRPAHDLDAAGAARGEVDVGVGLEATERQRRRTTTCRAAAPGDAPRRPRRAARGPPSIWPAARSRRRDSGRGRRRAASARRSGLLQNTR